MSATVTRRSALTAGLVALAGGVVGYVYARGSGATSAGLAATYGHGSGGSTASPLAAVAAIPDNGGLIKSGVVLTDVHGVVHAFSSTCTHLGCTVNRVAGGKIFCPCHGSVFDAATGAVVQGPAAQPLPRVRVRIRNGEVFGA